jgi:hypothetical protein
VVAVHAAQIWWLRLYIRPLKTKILMLGLVIIAFGYAFNSLALEQWLDEQAMVLHGHLTAKPADGKRLRMFPDTDVAFQFGPEGTIIKWDDGQPDFGFLTGHSQDNWAFIASSIKIRRVDGGLLLSVQIRDINGNMIVEVIDNDWAVSQYGSSWEKNYTENALEVRDGRGRVVLQVEIYDDRVQIQAEWWNEYGFGYRAFRPYPYDPIRTGPKLILMSPGFHPDNEQLMIQPIFLYPSRKYFGEYQTYRETLWDRIFVTRVLKWYLF